jgi:hypothetical protein
MPPRAREQLIQKAVCQHSAPRGAPGLFKAGKFPSSSRDDLDAWANRRLGQLVRSTSELIDHQA